MEYRNDVQSLKSLSKQLLLLAKYPISKRMKRVQVMEDKIKSVYFQAKDRYGSPRIREELCKRGDLVSLPTVAKHMKRMSYKKQVFTQI